MVSCRSISSAASRRNVWCRDWSRVQPALYPAVWSSPQFWSAARRGVSAPLAFASRGCSTALVDAVSAWHRLMMSPAVNSGCRARHPFARQNGSNALRLAGQPPARDRFQYAANKASRLRSPLRCARASRFRRAPGGPNARNASAVGPSCATSFSADPATALQVVPVGLHRPLASIWPGACC